MTNVVEILDGIMGSSKALMNGTPVVTPEGYTQDINVVNNIKAEYEDNDYFYILVKTAISLDGGYS